MSTAMACQVRDEILAACVLAGMNPYEVSVTVEFNQYWGGRDDYCLVVASYAGERFGERLRFKDIGRRFVMLRRMLIALLNHSLQRSIYGEVCRHERWQETYNGAECPDCDKVF